MLTAGRYLAWCQTSFIAINRELVYRETQILLRLVSGLEERIYQGVGGSESQSMICDTVGFTIMRL